MSNKEIGEACKALGLENVRKLTLYFEVEKPAIAEVEMYVFDEMTLEKFSTVVKRYTLVEEK